MHAKSCYTLDIIRSFHSQLPNVGACSVNPCYMHQYVDVVTGRASVMYCYYWSGHSVILGNAQPLNDCPCIDLCDYMITLFSKPATMHDGSQTLSVVF